MAGHLHILTGGGFEVHPGHGNIEQTFGRLVQMPCVRVLLHQLNVDAFGSRQFVLLVATFGEHEQGVFDKRIVVVTGLQFAFGFPDVAQLTASEDTGIVGGVIFGDLFEGLSAPLKSP